MRRIAFIFFSFFLVACATAGGPGDPTVGVTPEGIPAWVNKGSGAYNGPYGKCFYGVGALSGVQNLGLARQAVDNRSRGEIAKIFDLYIAAMMKDYQRSTTAGNFQASAEEQDIVSTQKTITEVTLRGVEVRDHWTDPRSGTIYALAILDLKNIDEAMGNSPQLNEKVRDYVRENARRAFEDMDGELQKRSDRSEPAAPSAAPSSPEPSVPQAAEAPVPPPPPRLTPAPVRANAKVGLKILGNGAPKIQTCFAEEMTKSGMIVHESTSDVDVMVHGTLRYAKAGEVEGSVMVRADIDLRVTDTNSGRTLAAFSDDIKVGRTALDQSVQLAIFRLCHQVAPKLVEKIQGSLRK